ncbi:DsbA family oxidoreductase [Thalassobacillus pellis]|uniref:DsbA family oxidoreductase n=1 Tax=Thalassobacillus pellis TaxID=748008 RepID=UPI00195F8574|nr:DsbA family oxidoreductase [Thalassobacillus pellis]MBM7552048.1 putative DsbA family dithiol-disulfide isomerase [Thalassobacillus pellis]
MKIEVWSDIVCPFCYIGKRRLESALEKFEHREEIKLSFKSFQLDPSFKRDGNTSIHEKLAAKYNVSVDQAKSMHDQMTEQAHAAGLEYNFDDVIPTNTEDAHRLSHYAKSQGKMEVFMEQAMKAYFTDGRDIGDHDELVKLSEEVGLDKRKARQVLEEGTYREAVVLDQQEGTKIGVQGVPFFVFNNKYAVSGAQSPDTFLEVLEKVWKEENEQPAIQKLHDDSTGESCTDDSC